MIRVNRREQPRQACGEYADQRCRLTAALDFVLPLQLRLYQTRPCRCWAAVNVCATLASCSSCRQRSSARAGEPPKISAPISISFLIYSLHRTRPNVMPRSRFRCRRLIALEFFILIKGAVRFDDRLQIELPLLTEAESRCGAALQEQLHEESGEMFPPGNYAQPSRRRAAFPDRPDLNCDRCSSARAGLLPK